MEVSDRIKQLLSINDVISHYGYQVDRKGFISCPFHNEKTASLKIYQESNSFHCFGCGANGDVIKFVMLLYSVDFKQAVKQINSEFYLNLFEKPTLSQARKNKLLLESIAKKKRAKEIRQAYNKYAYRKMVEYLHYLWKLPSSTDRQHDIDFMRRLMSQFIDMDDFNCTYDVDALIAALKTKFEGV